jgi:hypothetical protein
VTKFYESLLVPVIFAPKCPQAEFSVEGMGVESSMSVLGDVTRCDRESAVHRSRLLRRNFSFSIRFYYFIYKACEKAITTMF